MLLTPEISKAVRILFMVRKLKFRQVKREIPCLWPLSCREAEGGVAPKSPPLPEVLLDSTTKYRTILSEKELCELRFTDLFTRIPS